MQKTTAFIVTLIALLGLTLAGCSTTKVEQEPNNSEDNGAPSTDENTVEKPVKNDTADEDKDSLNDTPDTTSPPEIPMSDFFLEDGAKAHYQGEGNEFAEIDIEVVRPFENYVITHENNGGSYLQKVYRIGEDKIEFLLEEMIEFDPVIPTLDQLDKMTPIAIYLQQPFEVGKVFDDWEIVDIDASVETPYEKFNKAIVIELSEDDFVNRIYFVQGIGEVKRESIMSIEGEEDFIVTSMLESIE